VSYRIPYRIISCIISGIGSSIIYQRRQEMGKEDKIRENRLRRMAKRQGLELRASGRRDPRALDYGKYVLVNAERNVIVGVASGRSNFTLDDVENYLTQPVPPPLGQGAANRESAAGRDAVQTSARSTRRRG
jgi:hypothetical protein